VEPVNWLDEEELATWKAFSHATRLLSAQLEQDLQRETGMGFTHYYILVRLSEAPDRTLRMSELAEAMAFSRSAVSHAVARLENLGWVSRRECPPDRRGAFAELTDCGMAALEEAAPAHVASVRQHLFDGLSRSQLRQLHAVSDQLRTHLLSTGTTCPEETSDDAVAEVGH
jgi:DNA-binding MarR family transcriptional regulator